MLKSVDVLIGLTVVMLVASMAVTVMTGFIHHLFNLRGRFLRQGLGDLLRLVDPALEQPAKIAETVLTHPLIRDAEQRMGGVIHREELIKLLMELAAGNGPQTLARDLQQRLAATLKEHGIADPAATLDKIRAAAVQIEKEKPELPNTARATCAILAEAESLFVAEIHCWFDQTMDRISHRFTLSTRRITLICAMLLVAVLQLDAIAVMNRIYVDETLRQSLVEKSARIAPNDQQNYSFVIDAGVVPLPDYPAGLARFEDMRHVAGMIVTTLLLSLGAPFWYHALNQLLQLRPKIAEADDLMRQAREMRVGR